MGKQGRLGGQAGQVGQDGLAPLVIPESMDKRVPLGRPGGQDGPGVQDLQAHLGQRGRGVQQDQQAQPDQILIV